MRESITYQPILEEGRLEGVAIGRNQGLAEGVAQGLVEGRGEGERRVLLRLATTRFGAPSAAVRDQIASISDRDPLRSQAGHTGATLQVLASTHSECCKSPICDK